MLQGLAQRVLQFGRDARVKSDAAQSRRRDQRSQDSATSQQPQGVGLPAALGLAAAATLFLGPSAPFFLFSFLPFLAAGSRGPRYAAAGLPGAPYPPQQGMGFQVCSDMLLQSPFTSSSVSWSWLCSVQELWT